MSRETHAPSAISILRQVKEDRELYIPDFISENPRKARPKTYSAANDHARELREAEQNLDDALNLAGVLRAAVQGEDDSRAMQADTVLKIVENKLSEAHRGIDAHVTRHLNLFMAYCDLREAQDGTAQE